MDFIVARILEGVVFVDRDERGERLLAHHLHLGARVDYDRGIQHPPFPLSADQHLRPLGHRP